MMFAWLICLAVLLCFSFAALERLFHLIISPFRGQLSELDRSEIRMVCLVRLQKLVLEQQIAIQCALRLKTTFSFLLGLQGIVLSDILRFARVL